VKRRLLVAAPLLVLVALVAWLVRPKHEVIGQAYVNERAVTLWNSRAQVRQAVGTAHFGDKLDILSRRGEHVRVRAVSGTTGWVDERLLMEPGLWQQSAKLLAQSRGMPVQARGRTKVLTNVRIEPGRTAPRLYQFNRGADMELLSRAVADWTQNVDEKESGNVPDEVKKEDWFLVRGVANRDLAADVQNAPEAPATDAGDQSVPIAGWVVARFVELDLPGAVREGALSTGMRVLAWFELNRVLDASGEKPQYLVAGMRGPEGQPCDFTTLRVYTWSRKLSRYETAFIENNLCGKLPVRVGKSPAGDPEFRFGEMGALGTERVYRMRQTIVRRVREEGEGKSRTAARLPVK
jgi:hypothetical protein